MVDSFFLFRYAEFIEADCLSHHLKTEKPVSRKTSKAAINQQAHDLQQDHEHGWNRSGRRERQSPRKSSSCFFIFITMEKPQLEKLRHSAAHMLAAAVLDLYPDAKLGTGPAIENGFYYDIQFKHPISEADLSAIEKRMKKMISGKHAFVQHSITKSAAQKKFQDQPFKLELIKKFSKEKKKLTIVESGPFTDLCEGGHVDVSTEIQPKALKLTQLAGAYWQADEKNPQMTRIYGLLFETPEQLQTHLHQQEEAKRRDHRKLGRDLDLFYASEMVGQGLPLLTEHGAAVRRELERWVVDEEIKRGYLHVKTPDLGSIELYKTSGHYPYFKEGMYPVMKVDEDELVLRPMACPHHFVLFQRELRSYRDLPMRIAEVANYYRYEKSGELSGLVRVRMFTLTDAHIFCRVDQGVAEIKQALDLIEDLAKTLGLVHGEHYWFRLSLGDPKDKKKYFDDPKGWSIGEATLKDALQQRHSTYIEAKNEAAFYGPKIDVQMRNVNGKEDTAFTVQYDFCLPQRFKLRYINTEGKEERPIVIHRSSIGALERTLAFLIERTAGAFPLWLAPIQVALVPVSEHFLLFAEELNQTLLRQSFRTKVFAANETVGNRIRQTAHLKIPYVLVLGEQEKKSKELTVRIRGQQQTQRLTLSAFLEQLTEQRNLRQFKP